MTDGVQLRIVRALALVCAVVCAGCGSMGAEGEAWMEANAADSAAADSALAAGDRAEAIERLRAIAERERPAAVAEQDARVVRQDAYDRWARIEIARGDAERARQLVERALALGEEEDVFTANLLTTRGKLHEMRGADREAARDYHRALIIEEGLLDRALGGGE